MRESSSGHCPQSSSASEWRDCHEKMSRSSEKTINQAWRKGYFCAVSVLLREEGSASEVVRSLFRQGGSVEGIDATDIALFREHGLLD